MTRHFYTFLGTFVVGALIALAARATLFDPNRDHSGHPTTGGDYAPMVANATPVADAHTGHTPDAPAPAATTPANEHSAHTATDPQPVNTVCAICGMEVDPDLPTAVYDGKTIGFGCKACPSIFKANPEKYGPAYLRNEVMKR